jgi:hypothetical protein
VPFLCTRDVPGRIRHFGGSVPGRCPSFATGKPKFGLPNRFQVKVVYSSPSSLELYAIGQQPFLPCFTCPVLPVRPTPEICPYGIRVFFDLYGVAETLDRTTLYPDAANADRVASNKGRSATTKGSRNRVGAPNLTSSLCQTFRQQASQVWNRMRAAAALGISLSEETLTELTLYNIAVAHQKAGQIEIDIATKSQEKAHGADWEWWLVRNKKNICYRVQAKRLFPNGRYNSLYKSGSGNPYAQLDTLVSAAKTNSAVPMYCFYNFNHSNFGFGTSHQCLHKYRGPSFWGCTLAAAQDVRTAGANDAATLRHIMQPWHLFACAHHGEDIVDTGTRFVSDRHFLPSDDISLNKGQTRLLPAYVARLIETRRSTSSRQKKADYLDDQFWSEAKEKEDLAGIAVFNDVRD